MEKRRDRGTEGQRDRETGRHRPRDRVRNRVQEIETRSACVFVCGVCVCARERECA